MNLLLDFPPFAAHVARVEWANLTVRNHSVTSAQDIQIEVEGRRSFISYLSLNFSAKPAFLWMEWATFEGKLLFRQSTQKLTKHHFNLPSLPELRVVNNQLNLSIKIYHPTGRSYQAHIPATPRTRIFAAEFFEVEGGADDVVGFLSVREKAQDGTLTQRLVWVHFSEEQQFQFTDTSPIPLHFSEDIRIFF